MLVIRDSLFRGSMRNYASFFLIALFFFVPVSSSGKSIFMALAVVSILASPEYRQQLAYTFFTRWFKTALFLMLFVVVACFWSPASSSEKWFVLEKYSKLLYLPILAAGFQGEKTRRLALQAFMAAMLLTSILSMIKYSGFLDKHFLAHAYLINQDSVFRNHIMTGIMMSFATYLAGLFFFREPAKTRFIYVALGLIYSYQIFFISIGRTGYIVYALLMSLLMVQFLSKRQAVLGLGIVFASLVFFYNFSPFMQSGVKNIFTEWQHFKEDKNTSIGYRLQFHQYAQDLFNRHSIIGNGTGSFTYLFRTEKPVPSWDRTLLEPHSQYWLVLAEFGTIGIIGLVLFLGTLFISSSKLKAMRPVAFALLLIFCIGNLSDSLLFYSGSGYFFIIFMALCLGEGIAVKDKFSGSYK